MAPYDVHVVVLNLDQEAVARRVAGAGIGPDEGGTSTCSSMTGRDSAGIKFKDADLLGMPTRLTLGPRSLEKGGVEVRDRTSGEVNVVAIAEVAAAIRNKG